jgi:hypothetical protein
MQNTFDEYCYICLTSVNLPYVWALSDNHLLTSSMWRICMLEHVAFANVVWCWWTDSGGVVLIKYKLKIAVSIAISIAVSINVIHSKCKKLSTNLVGMSSAEHILTKTKGLIPTPSYHSFPIRRHCKIMRSWWVASECGEPCHARILPNKYLVFNAAMGAHLQYITVDSFLYKDLYKYFISFHFMLFSINIRQVDKPGCGNGQYQYRVRIHQLYVQHRMNLSLK